MEPKIVKIIRAEPVTPNVNRFTLQRPEGLTFIPGQAAEISINLEGWKDEIRPFTFTGLTDWDHLEFTIKSYPDRKSVTDQLAKLKPGNELIIHKVFGAIHYYGEGTFIAGGAGVTPFIAIFRQLEKENKLGKNKLIFSNSTANDIILKEEFTRMLGKNFINTVTHEKTDLYDNRRIDEKYLSEKLEDFNQYFYLCGPDPMVEGLHRSLLNLGVADEKIIIEQF